MRFMKLLQELYGWEKREAMNYASKRPKSVGAEFSARANPGSRPTRTTTTGSCSRT